MPSDANAVALTFDDGFVNFGDVAAPLLADHGMPSTLFVVSTPPERRTGGQGAPTAAFRSCRCSNWDALGRLGAQGVEIGAHTRTHVNVARLTNAASPDEIVGGAERIRTELGYDAGGVRVSVRRREQRGRRNRRVTIRVGLYDRHAVRCRRTRRARSCRASTCSISASPGNSNDGERPDSGII